MLIISADITVRLLSSQRYGHCDILTGRSSDAMQKSWPINRSVKRKHQGWNAMLEIRGFGLCLWPTRRQYHSILRWWIKGLKNTSMLLRDGHCLGGLHQSHRNHNVTQSILYTEEAVWGWDSSKYEGLNSSSSTRIKSCLALEATIS